MKKLIIVFSLIVILIPLLPNKEVFASVEAPEKPIEVDCPPGYVGEKKCFVVTNPRVKKAKPIQPEVELPENKEVRKTTAGKKITKHPYTWAIGTFVGFITSQSTTAQNISDSFWSNMNEIDLMAGNIANRITDESAEALQNAYEYATLSGTNIVNLATNVWNELFELTKNEIANTSTSQAFITAMNEVLIDKYVGVAADVFGYVKTRYNLSILYSVYLSPQYSNTYFVYGVDVMGPIYEVVQVEVSILADGTFQPNGSRRYSPTYSSWESARKRILEESEGLQEGSKSGYSPSSVGTPSNMGTMAPIVPMTANTSPKVVEIDGRKYYSSPNKTSPAHPDLEPLPQAQPDGTPIRTGTKIPGHTLIDEDGYPIDEGDGKRSPTPITTPVTNPLPKDDPEYKTPTFPWLPTPTPTNPTNPNSNCNKCLPDLIPNFFGLFAVFFTFLLACIVYLGKLAVFILTIPMIPEKKFEGTIGKTFEFIKNLEIGGLEIYNTMLALVTLLFSFLIYKVIRRLW